MKVTLFSILIFTFNTMFSQTSIFLVKGDKEVESKFFNEVTFFEKYSTIDGKDSVEIVSFGHAISKNNKFVVLNPIFIRTTNYFSEQKVTNKNFHFFKNDNPRTSINLDNVYKIKTHHSDFKSTTSFIATLSALTAVIISPIVSNNFKDKTFNKNRFFRLEKISLATLTVALTLNITLGSRTYQIKGDKKEWKIK